MSGASPGGGHPGRGNSPSKAQAFRPTLGSNTQAVSKADASPKVVSEGKKAQNGSSSSNNKKDEAVKVRKVTEQGKAMAVGKKAPVKQSACQGKQSEVRLGEIQKKSTGEKQNGGKQPAAQEVPSPASGVQLTPSRQRRTSLERQTLQENLQQKHVVASMASSGRTRSQSGGSSKSAVEPGATKPAVVKVKETSGFKHPGTLLKAGSQEETPRAPELQVAEDIPGLVKKLGFLTCEIQEQTVSFPQSGTAVLPCLFVPSQKASYQLVKVSWQKEHELEDLVVHFQNGKDVGDKQNEIFKGRTMMSKNWFIEGNATLTLGHLTHGDAGKFTCWVTAYPIRPGQQKRCCIVILKISNQPIKQQSTSQGNDGSPSPLDQALALFFLLLVLGVLCFLPILLTSKRFSRS